MFEQSVVDARVMAQRPWTLAVSCAGQTAMVGMAVLLPLIFPEAMQIARLWVPIEPPRAYHPPPTQQVVRAVARPVTRTLAPHALYAPPSIPSRVHMIEDLVGDPPAVASAGGVPGVPGGIDLPGIGSPAVARLIDALPKPAAPAPALTPREQPKPTPAQIRQGGKVQEARLTYGPRPEYPPLARQARISGVVVLEAIIATDGSILHLHAISGHPLLVPPALEAVKRWRYKPTLLNGDPVEVATEISVHFMLQ